jgi:DNA-binding LytR/AlgR family response regulator
MLCQQIPELEVVKAFTEPEKLLREASTLDFDLCILDIEMPKMSGMRVAQLLKDKLTIFTTAYKKYAADAFDVNAVDFVPKPVTKDRLQVAVRKAIGRKKAKEQERQTVQFNTDKGRALIDASDIAYITTSEVDSRDKVAVMHGHGSIVLKNISFETLLSVLSEREFCRVNKKQVIALKIVSSFAFDEIVTTLAQSGKPLRISLSEAYRQNFQKAVTGIS